jgi:hypothetical protein
MVLMWALGLIFRFDKTYETGADQLNLVNKRVAVISSEARSWCAKLTKLKVYRARSCTHAGQRISVHGDQDWVVLDVCAVLREARRRGDLLGHARVEQNGLRTTKTTKRTWSPAACADGRFLKR